MKGGIVIKPDSRKINSLPLVDIVRQHLIEDIMEKRYLPGQKLPVIEISTRYGVSETPVKQAFNRLVTEGLLEALPRRGVVVRRISREDVIELMEARHMVYQVSVDAVMERIALKDSEIIDCIEKNLDDHRTVLSELTEHVPVELFLRYSRIDREYHLCYLRCVRNRFVEQFFNQLCNQSSVFISLSNIMGERIRQAYEDHKALYEAYQSGDKQLVLSTLHKHKEGAVRTAVCIFEKELSINR